MDIAMNDIRERRLKLGLSQSRLAAQLPGKIDAIALGFIENGRVLPTVDAMRILCEKFECEPTDMYAPGDLDLMSCNNPEPTPLDCSMGPGAPSGSGRQHDGRTEFRTWLLPAEKLALNTAVAQLGYRSGAEWFREMVRNTIARNKRLHGAATAGKDPEIEVL